MPLDYAMTRRRVTTVACLAVALLVGALLFVRSTVGIAEYAPRSITNQDPAFAVTTFAFTHGTKHTFSRGSGILGKINDSLISAGKLPVTKSRQWTLTTTQDTSVLWVSFTHSNALVGTAAPYIAALLTRPDGVTELIEPADERGRLVQAADPKSSGYMTAWRLPSRATNYPGWWFHLVTRPDGKRFASFEL